MIESSSLTTTMPKTATGKPSQSAQGNCRLIPQLIGDGVLDGTMNTDDLDVLMLSWAQYVDDRNGVTSRTQE